MARGLADCPYRWGLWETWGWRIDSMLPSAGLGVWDVGEGGVDNFLNVSTVGVTVGRGSHQVDPEESGG